MTLAIINKMPTIQSRYSSDTNSGSSTPLLPDVSVSGGAASDTYSLETNAGGGFVVDPAPTVTTQTWAEGHVIIEDDLTCDALTAALERLIYRFCLDQPISVS
jgi:hypothetical protein